MTSVNWNDIPNQFIITTDEWQIFQSYSSIIAVKDNKWNIILDENKHDYSRTTSKYRNQFLWERTKEVKQKIDSGEYKLQDLNK